MIMLARKVAAEETRPAVDTPISHDNRKKNGLKIDGALGKG